jgi:hypothetical protein
MYKHEAFSGLAFFENVVLHHRFIRIIHDSQPWASLTTLRKSLSMPSAQDSPILTLMPFQLILDFSKVARPGTNSDKSIFK